MGFWAGNFGKHKWIIQCCQDYILKNCAQTSKCIYLCALTLVLGLQAPQVSFIIQGVDEFGSQLDVIAEHLFVLSDPINITHPPSQVPVHPWGQLTVSQLWSVKCATDF